MPKSEPVVNTHGSGRYRCPHCESVQLYRRQKDAMERQSYKEYDDLKPFPQSSAEVPIEKFAKYYCENCRTPVGKDEVVDTSESARSSDFFYGDGRWSK